jgi:hypothetical protein
MHGMYRKYINFCSELLGVRVHLEDLRVSEKSLEVCNVAGAGRRRGNEFIGLGTLATVWLFVCTTGGESGHQLSY